MERAQPCLWWGVMGEEGKPEQLAALSRTHQGELEKRREREDERKMRMDGEMDGRVDAGCIDHSA